MTTARKIGCAVAISVGCLLTFVGLVFGLLPHTIDDDRVRCGSAFVPDQFVDPSLGCAGDLQTWRYLALFLFVVPGILAALGGTIAALSVPEMLTTTALPADEA